MLKLFSGVQAPMDGLALEVARGLSTALAVRGSAVACPDCVCQCSPTLACSEGALPQELAPALGPGGLTLFGLGVLVGALGVVALQRWACGARAKPPAPAAAAVEAAPLAVGVEKLALEQLEVLRRRRGGSA